MNQLLTKRILGVTLILSMLFSNVAYGVSGGTATNAITSEHIKTASFANVKENAEITQGELFRVINKSFGYGIKSHSKIKGMNKKDKYYGDYQIALKAGYFKNDRAAKASSKVTKLQLAIIIADILKESQSDSKKPQSFKEEGGLSKADLKKVQSIIDKGIMELESDGSFQPNRKVRLYETVNALEKGYLSQIKTTYKTAGTFSEKTIHGSVLIDTPNVVLENTEILGNLIIGKNVGDGDVKLKNVIVKGNTIVKGGGMNSITVEDCKFQNIMVIKENNKVRIVAVGTTTVESVEMASGGKLEESGSSGSGFGLVTIAENIDVNEPIIFAGSFSNITVEAGGVNISVIGGTVDNMQVAPSAQNAKVTVGENAVLKGVSVGASMELGGSGSVEKVEVVAEKVAMDITGNSKIGLMTVTDKASETTFKLGSQIKVAGMVLEAKTAVTGSGSVGTVDIAATGTSIGVKTDITVADKGVTFTDVKGAVMTGTKEPGAPNLLPEKPTTTTPTGNTGTGSTGTVSGGSGAVGGGTTTPTRPSGGEKGNGGTGTPIITPTVPTPPIVTPITATVKAHSANSFKVTFDKAPVDITKVQAAVTCGSALVNLNATWNTTHTEVVLASSKNLAVGTYSINIKNDGTDLGTTSIGIAAQKIADFKVTSNVLGRSGPMEYFATFTAQDQYGSDITNSGLCRGMGFKSEAGYGWADKGIVRFSGAPLTASTATIEIVDSKAETIKKTVTLPVATEIATLSEITLNKITTFDNDELTADNPNSVFFIDYTAKDLNGNETKNDFMVKSGLVKEGYNNLKCSNPMVSASVQEDITDPSKAIIEVRVVRPGINTEDVPFTVTAETLSGKKSEINLVLKKSSTTRPQYWFSFFNFNKAFMAEGATTTVDFAGVADQKLEVMHVPPVAPYDMVRDKMGLKVKVESTNPRAIQIGNYGKNNFSSSAILKNGDAIEIKSMIDETSGAFIMFKLFNDVNGDNVMDSSEFIQKTQCPILGIASSDIRSYGVSPVEKLYDIGCNAYFSTGDVVTAAGMTMGKRLEVYGTQGYGGPTSYNIKLNEANINLISSDEDSFYIDNDLKKVFARYISGDGVNGKIEVKITDASGEIHFATGDVVGSFAPIVPQSIEAYVCALGKDDFTPNTVTLVGNELSITAVELEQLAKEGLYYFNADGSATEFEKTSESEFVQNGFFQIVVHDNYKGSALIPGSTIITQTVDATASTPTTMIVDKDGKIIITGELQVGDQFTLATTASFGGPSQTYIIKIK